MAEFARLREALADHRIQDASDYAEALIAEARSGQREASGVNQGFDVKSPRFGRVEVKCRQLPRDGRIEERVDLRDSKKDGIDYLAILVFLPGFRVKGAVLVPYGQVWTIIESRKYRRISYAEARQLDGAIDISGAVAKAAEQ
jgi:hypothetical protein